METCNVTVRHKGRLTSTVRRRAVTPAETVLLRELHGADAVVEFELNPTPIKRDSVAEIERLRDFYGVSAEQLKIIDNAFPGHSPKLPETFAEIGVAVDAVEKRERKRRPADTAVETENVLA
ncbi:MAG: hypothetical protein RJQ08_03855 [Salinisphaeraceae bacterium]